jgi:cytochrome c oxidase subunit 3
MLFIVSEVMLFASFFWAYFHFAADPSVHIGCVWPPEGIEPLNPFGVPLLNTYILLFSGATVTYTHYSVISGNLPDTELGFMMTLFLAGLFTLFQLLEYKAATFTIADGVYGSTFYMITGLHGLHVIVGTIFLFVCFVRTIFRHFTRDHHLGLEFAIWYWHFVDVVWLFVFTGVYYWGSIRV